MRYCAGGVYIVDLTNSEVIGIAMLLFALFAVFLVHRRKKSDRQINASYPVILNSDIKTGESIEDEDTEVVVSIEDIKQKNDSDGLSCVLEITIIIPEEYDGFIKIEDEIDPNEWVLDSDEKIKEHDLGNGTKKVVFISEPLYLGRKLIIFADVSEDFDDSPVEQKYTTKQEK